MQIVQSEHNAKSRKTELCVKLVNDFHECTNGGRFFRISGDGIIIQLLAEQLLRGQSNFILNYMHHQIKKIKKEEQQLGGEKKQAGKFTTEQHNKLCCMTIDASVDDSVTTANTAALDDVDYGKQFEIENGNADKFVLCESALVMVPSPPPQKKRNNTHPLKWHRKALCKGK